MKKKIVLVLAIFILILIVVAGSVIIKMGKEIEDFDKTPIDISKVADGTYYGKTETALVKVEVEVIVSDGKIADIEILRHDCGKGLPANAVVDDMVSKNSPEVDAVSGATASSEIIKDAVRKALRDGVSEQ